MAYKLVVTEHADKLLDNILHYLIHQLENYWKKLRVEDAT